MARTDVDPRHVAQGLADHFNSVLNATVSKARLSVISEKGSDPPHFDIARLAGNKIVPLELNGTTALLLIQHKIEVVDAHCATLTYAYRYQQAKAPNSWVCRWEYSRRPPKAGYPYPLGHFHLNADLRGASDATKDIHEMHFPTDRVSLESVLLSLIQEWGVKPLTERWRQTLSDSYAGFAERRTAP